MWIVFRDPGVCVRSKSSWCDSATMRHGIIGKTRRAWQREEIRGGLVGGHVKCAMQRRAKKILFHYVKSRTWQDGFLAILSSFGGARLAIRIIIQCDVHWRYTVAKRWTSIAPVEFPVFVHLHSICQRFLFTLCKPLRVRDFRWAFAPCVVVVSSSLFNDWPISLSIIA